MKGCLMNEYDKIKDAIFNPQIHKRFIVSSLKQIVAEVYVQFGDANPNLIRFVHADGTLDKSQSFMFGKLYETELEATAALEKRIKDA